MDALSRPFDPGRGQRPRWLPFPARAVVPFVFLGAVVMVPQDAVPRQLVLSIAGAGFHGALLSAAFAAAWGKTRGWQRPAWLLAGLLFLAMLSAQLLAWGAVAYLLVPLALGVFGMRRPELRRIGWRWPEDRPTWLLGAGVGLFLGGHLLLSASRTLGYPLRPDPVEPLLAAIAYDAGASVLSAELFFRGVIFNFWQRRRGFWVGAILSTGACLLRYALDPTLPRTLEVAIGALFYVTLLSLASCALVTLSGSLLPSILASLFFFGAYRTLQLW